MIILENIEGLRYSVKIPVMKTGDPEMFYLIHSATQQSITFQVSTFQRVSGMICFEITFEKTPFTGQYNYTLYSSDRRLSEGLAMIQAGGVVETITDDFYFDYEAVPSKDGFIHDAVITFVDQDGNLLGDFSVNQTEDETIVIKQADPVISYDDLIDKPTIGDATITLKLGNETIGEFTLNQTRNQLLELPAITTPGNGQITIQVNGQNLGQFNLNDSNGKTINIEVPTKTSDLNNDAGFLTEETEFKNSPAKNITIQDIQNWNGKSDFSGDYNDLVNKPVIGEGILNIKRNNDSVGTFAANQTHNTQINIEVPTKTSDLTNDSGYTTFDGDYNSLTNKPTIGNVDIRLKVNNTQVGSFNTNQTEPSEINIEVPTKTSDLTNDSGFLTRETDPVFNASPASTITQQDITNWNNKGQSDFSGDYNDLRNKPTIGNGTVTIMHGSDTIGTFSMNQTTDTTISLPDAVALTQAQYDALEEIDPDTIYLITDPISYNDLIDKPTIGNGSLTIQKNGSTVAIFTANDVNNKTANIEVPTKTSDLVNDSGYITGFTETDPVFNASPAKNITTADITNWNSKGTSNFSGDYTDLTNKPTIPSIWQGTLAEYNALPSHDNNTLYIITDQSQHFTVYDSTITLKNGNQILGYFTLNQANSAEIDLAPVLQTLTTQNNRSLDDVEELAINAGSWTYWEDDNE